MELQMKPVARNWTSFHVLSVFTLVRKLANLQVKNVQRWKHEEKESKVQEEYPNILTIDHSDVSHCGQPISLHDLLSGPLLVILHCLSGNFFNK